MIVRSITAALFAGFLVVQPAQAVELPDWDTSGLCKGEAFPGHCRLLERSARLTISGGWGLLPEAYRTACLEQVKQPYDKSYRLLSQCLEEQVLVGLDKDLIDTSAVTDEKDSGGGAVEYPNLPTDDLQKLIELRESWGTGQ